MPFFKRNHSFSWHSFGITHAGKARKYNEDALLERTAGGIWLVADGVGGHTAGDLASQMIVDVMKQVQVDVTLDKCIDNIEDCLLSVNNMLLKKAKERTAKPAVIGSTVVILLLYERYCVYIWAGDSRLYRLRDGQIRQMTTDHSQVEEYIAQGIIKRHEAAKHPHGNIITRAIGAADNLHLDMEIQAVKAKDRYLLCSDGLTKHLPDLELQDILQEKTAKAACTTLIEVTLDRGAMDNVTAVVVDIV